MNKRLEEKLAMLAFGDMSSEEMTRLEHEVMGDPEAMRALQDYRGMRSGLKALGDIPEHQLSSERLRHAVLNRGLQPKSRPQLGWLWMPAMTAVVFFSVFMARKSHNAPLPFPPSGAVAVGPSNNDLITESHPEEAFALATASGEILSVEQPASKLRTASRSVMPRRHHTERYRLDASDDSGLPDLGDDLGFDSTLGGGTGAFKSTKEASVPQPSGAPIVLIDGSKDKSTGAQKATEVESASNVVVGG